MSIHANLEELERGSVLLAEAAADAAALAVRAAGWGALMTVAAQHGALAAALGDRTAELSTGLLSVGAEAQALELAVGFSVQSYRDAEARALRAVQQVTGVPALALAVGLGLTGERIPLTVVELALHGGVDTGFALLRTMSPGLAFGAWIASDLTGRQSRDEGRTGALTAPERLYPLITAGGVATGLLQIGPVRVRSGGGTGPGAGGSGAVEGSEARVMDGSLTALLDHLDRGREEVAGPGAVQVTHITPDAPGAPDRVWLVALPGTQSGDHRDEEGWSTNPFDLGGNGEAMALDSQHVAAGVHEALQVSGARPGDTVVFTGYSQGGIHAARLAADPRIAAAYDVQGVLTVGSPTAGIAVPQDVEALHLEHDEDVVPGLDGRGNPQGVHRTTVTFAGTVEGAAPPDDSVLGAHGFENYRAHVVRLEDGAARPDGGAVRADAGAAPGRGPDLERTATVPVTQAARLAPSLEHLAALTAGTAVTRSVTLERTRPGKPRNPLEAGSGLPVRHHHRGGG